MWFCEFVCVNSSSDNFNTDWVDFSQCDCDFNLLSVFLKSLCNSSQGICVSSNLHAGTWKHRFSEVPIRHRGKNSPKGGAFPLLQTLLRLRMWSSTQNFLRLSLGASPPNVLNTTLTSDISQGLQLEDSDSPLWTLVSSFKYWVPTVTSCFILITGDTDSQDLRKHFICFAHILIKDDNEELNEDTHKTHEK